VTLLSGRETLRWRTKAAIMILHCRYVVLESPPSGLPKMQPPTCLCDVRTTMYQDAVSFVGCHDAVSFVDECVWVCVRVRACVVVVEKEVEEADNKEVVASNGGDPECYSCRQPKWESSGGEGRKPVIFLSRHGQSMVHKTLLHLGLCFLTHALYQHIPPSHACL